MTDDQLFFSVYFAVFMMMLLLYILSWIDAFERSKTKTGHMIAFSVVMMIGAVGIFHFNMRVPFVDWAVRLIAIGTILLSIFLDYRAIRLMFAGQQKKLLRQPE